MREKNVLTNLFKAKTTTSYATVLVVVSSTRCIVVDRVGRKMSVEKDISKKLSIGASVIVRDGRIIGSGSQAGKHRTYEV